MSCSRWYIWAARKGISKRGRTRSSFFLQQIHITPQNEMGMVIRGSTYSLMLPLQQLNSHCKVQTTWRKEEDEMFVVIRKKQVHRRRNRRCCVFSGLRVVASPASCWWFRSNTGSYTSHVYHTYYHCTCLCRTYDALNFPSRRTCHVYIHTEFYIFWDWFFWILQQKFLNIQLCICFNCLHCRLWAGQICKLSQKLWMCTKFSSYIITLFIYQVKLSSV